MKNKLTKVISILILLLSSSYAVYASSYPMTQDVVKQVIQESTVEVMLMKIMCPQCEDVMTWMDEVRHNVSDIY